MKDTFDLPSHPIPPIKLALRARGVNPALDPGGRCKGLVETSKGLWSPLFIIPQLPNLTSNFDKKGPWSAVDLKHLTFRMIFQKHISPSEFGRKIKPKHPNLTSKFQTHNNVGDNF